MESLYQSKYCNTEQKNTLQAQMDQYVIWLII